MTMVKCLFDNLTVNTSLHIMVGYCEIIMYKLPVELLLNLALHLICSILQAICYFLVTARRALPVIAVEGLYLAADTPAQFCQLEIKRYCSKCFFLQNY
jgi:hypothetical protein